MRGRTQVLGAAPKRLPLLWLEREKTVSDLRRARQSLAAAGRKGEAISDKIDFVIRRDRLGRWIIGHPTDRYQAWSGFRWVTVTEAGLPLSVQVCNFETPNEAAEYAEKCIKPPEEVADATTPRGH